MANSWASATIFANIFCRTQSDYVCDFSSFSRRVRWSGAPCYSGRRADGGYGLTLEAYKFLLSNTLYAEVFLKSFGVAASYYFNLPHNGLSACIVNHAQQKTFSKLDGVAGSTSICE